MARLVLPLLFLVSGINGRHMFSQTPIQGSGAAQAKPESGYVILFERTGGYAGWHDRFWIYADGRVVNEGGEVKRVTPKQVTALTQRLEALLPQGSPEVQKRQNYCCDCYRYRIAVRSGPAVRSVTLSEPLRTKSDPLARLAQEVRDLVFGNRF